MEKKAFIYGSIVLISSILIYNIFKNNRKKYKYDYYEAILVDSKYI